MKLYHTAAIALVWFFLAFSEYVGIIQVGPFATETSCQNYQGKLTEQHPLFAADCFSTTATK